MEKFELQMLRDLPIEGVAERMGMEVTRHKALCPFHDDHHASLSFNVRKNTYRCFVCGAHGGTIDLVMKGLRKDFIEACSWLGGESVSSFRFQDSGSRVQSSRVQFDASRYERYFQRPYLSPEARRFLFEERRLDERVVRWCRLTSWRDRQGVNWLQIPYYERDGRLTGIQNRNLDSGSKFQDSGDLKHETCNLKPAASAAPRFRFPQGSECGIYNLPILNRLHEGEELWITEGASDCWAALSAGHKAIAIPSATLLKRKDEPGERLFLQLQQLLPNLTHHQLPPTCKDFSDYYLQLASRVRLAAPSAGPAHFKL